jgi:hypothetical protein
MPVPPDTLIEMAGLTATSVSLEPTNRVFTVYPPRRQASKLRSFEIPNDQTPLWLIFKYDLEEEEEVAKEG